MNVLPKMQREWGQDLEYLARELPTCHKNLFFKISRSEFEQSVGKLDANIPSMSDYGIIVNLARIVASVGDSHTRLFWEKSSIFKAYPLKLYWFKDGLHVVETTSNHRPLLGSGIVRIGDIPIDDVVCAIQCMIAYENEPQLRVMGCFLAV